MKAIHKKTLVPAPLKEVWDAWTTSEGAETFFAPKAKVKLKYGGAYEMYFDLDQPQGLQGSEGCIVLSFQPREMLSFDWSAPPHIPEVRNKRSFVIVKFAETCDDITEVKIAHLGFGKGKDWDETYRYFERAWDIVLERLKRRFEKGPIDWTEEYSD